MNAIPPTCEAHEREPTNTLQIDIDYYAQYLTDYDLTDTQKEDMISTIANIMLAFVDMGFGITPIQTICSEDDILPENMTALPDDLLYSDHSPSDNFEENAACYLAAPGEEL